MKCIKINFLLPLALARQFVKCLSSHSRNTIFRKNALAMGKPASQYAYACAAVSMCMCKWQRSRPVFAAPSCQQNGSRESARMSVKHWASMLCCWQTYGMWYEFLWLQACEWRSCGMNMSTNTCQQTCTAWAALTCNQLHFPYFLRSCWYMYICESGVYVHAYTYMRLVVLVHMHAFDVVW